MESEPMLANFQNEVVLPTIPDELLIKIFARSEAKIVGRVRTLSISWNQILTSTDFVCMHLNYVKERASSSLVHFGMKGARAIGSWVMRFNMKSGNREPLRMPFLRNNQGRIDIVGSENGNVALRYATEGRPPSLIVWNPTTSKVSRLDDPMMHAGLLGTCAYAFAYLPGSLDYVWLYIYRQSIVDQHCVIASYSTVTGVWDRDVLCPLYVQVLDPKYVVPRGNVYWISWNNNGMTRPQCIVYYSIVDKQFDHMLIPVGARSNMTRLLVHDDRLCFASVHRMQGVYRWFIWRVQEVEGSYSWQLWSEYHGIGSAEYPECFSGDEIVTVQDTSIARFRGANPNGTRVSICKVNPISDHRTALQLEVAPFPFYVKSLTLSLNSIVPVEGGDIQQ